MAGSGRVDGILQQMSFKWLNPPKNREKKSRKIESVDQMLV